MQDFCLIMIQSNVQVLIHFMYRPSHWESFVPALRANLFLRYPIVSAFPSLEHYDLNLYVIERYHTFRWASLIVDNILKNTISRI